MSIRSKALKVSVCFLTGGIAFYSYSQLSFSAQKHTPLYEKIIKTKKLQAPAIVKMDLLEEDEVLPDKDYNLQATVKSEKSFANAEWEWTAPAGVVLLDRTSGPVQKIAANQELTFKMRFRQQDNANHRIRFIVKDPSTGTILGRGNYNSTRQRTIAQENKELLERQEKYLEENPDLILKGKELKHHH
jgi:hypothetical protein